MKVMEHSSRNRAGHKVPIMLDSHRAVLAPHAALPGDHGIPELVPA
jgi:hypothetical protein